MSVPAGAPGAAGRRAAAAHECGLRRRAPRRRKHRQDALALALRDALSAPRRRGRGAQTCASSATAKGARRAGRTARHRRRADPGASRPRPRRAGRRRRHSALMIAVYSDQVFGDTALRRGRGLAARVDLTLLTALDLPWRPTPCSATARTCASRSMRRCGPRCSGLAVDFAGFGDGAARRRRRSRRSRRAAGSA